MPSTHSDNFWCQKKHPSLLASRCIPCHSNITESQVDKAAEANTQSVFQKAVAAARLKKVPAPQTAPHTLRNSKRLDAFLPKEACMHCSPALACAGQHSGSCKMGEWHGGSGAVFSVGLLERVSYEDVLGWAWSLSGSLMYQSWNGTTCWKCCTQTCACLWVDPPMQSFNPFWVVLLVLRPLTCWIIGIRSISDYVDASKLMFYWEIFDDLVIQIYYWLLWTGFILLFLSALALIIMSYFRCNFASSLCLSGAKLPDCHQFIWHIARKLVPRNFCWCNHFF